MKKILWMIAVAMMNAMSVQAQTDIKLDNEAMYFNGDEMPNAVVCPHPSCRFPSPFSTYF